MTHTFILKILRGIPKKQYWEEFELPREAGANVISALMDIQKNPTNRKGEKVEPVVWEQGCLEEVCGSCSMLINGRPRQACSAIIEMLIKASGSTTIALAPFTKFPLIRDLFVDRSRMFQDLIDIHGWVEADGTFIKGFGPKISPHVQDVMYVLSTCMTCGCCLEACPQINQKSKFIGPAAVSQVRYFNANPTGKLETSERMKPLLGEGGIEECGNAQNCIQVCPKHIPLTESIAAMGREATKEGWRNVFSKPERD